MIRKEPGEKGREACAGGKSVCTGGSAAWRAESGAGRAGPGTTCKVPARSAGPQGSEIRGAQTERGLEMYPRSDGKKQDAMNKRTSQPNRGLSAGQTGTPPWPLGEKAVWKRQGDSINVTPRAPELGPRNAASQKSTGTPSNDLIPRGQARPKCQEGAEQEVAVKTAPAHELAIFKLGNSLLLNPRPPP